MATGSRSEATGPRPSHQPCPLVAKLERFVLLSPSDVVALEALCDEPERLPSQHVLIAEGDRPAKMIIMLRGLAIRYKSWPGRRGQILGYLASGDLSDPYCADLDPADHTIQLLGECWISSVPIDRFLATLRDHRQIERGVLLLAMAEQAILREWLANIGQRDAYEKLAHFFCEMAIRLEAAGQGNGDGSVDLPLSQGVLANTTGLTHIHINRILKRLRAQGLIILDRRRLTIPNPASLAATIDFEREYLDAPLIRY